MNGERSNAALAAKVIPLREDAPANHRILVIDDNRAIHDDIRKIFEAEEPISSDLLDLSAQIFDDARPVRSAAGFEVESAFQGRQGFELVCESKRKGKPYAVAFVDVRMPPGWDGVETIRQIRAYDRDIQLVICTAYSDYSWSDIVDQLGEGESLLILKKPFDSIELTQMAHALTEKWSLRRALDDRMRDLEDVVETRTRELAETNKRLQKEILDREAMEASLRLSQKLEAVGQLAAGVAHEINNPLAYVAANLTFVSEALVKGRRGDGIDWNECVNALDDARDGAVRVQQIVASLKAFSRADDESRGAVSVSEVLRYAVDVTWNQIRHRARLRKDFGEIPAVFGSAGRLGQVCVNLLVNAAQSIAEGAADKNEIVIATRTDDAGRVVLEVRDTGAGMGPDVLRRIFDPFFTTKPIGVGTGLGLAICHGIVKGMGGEIEVESAIGAGSTFRLLLPAHDGTPPSRRLLMEHLPNESGVRRARVLVVDDEPDIGFAIRRLLTGIHDVVSVTSSHEALSRLRRGERYDIVLCDLMMPELTGMDLYDAIREELPDQIAKVRFVTGGAFTIRAAKFLEAFPHPVLAKPFEQGLLRRYIADAIGSLDTA